MNGVPAWLRRALPRPALIQDLVADGVGVLVRAALVSRGRSKTSGREPGGADAIRVERLPPPLRALIARASDAGDSGHPTAAQIATNIAGWNAAARQHCKQGRMASLDAFEALRRICRGQAEGPVSSDSFAPLNVLVRARRRLQSRVDEVALDAADVDAMVVVGLAFRALRRSERCTFCFRWAYPGLACCGQHSLASEVGGTAAGRQAAYQAGRRTCEAVAQASWSQSPRYHHISERDALWIVARCVWGATIPREHVVVERVRLAIVHAPAVRRAAAELGLALTDVAPASLIDVLARWLDPYEVRPRVWRQEVFAAERWLQCERHANPGVRRSGKATSRRIDEALVLSARPGASIASVASELRCHPTTISKWFRQRDTDPRVARIHSRLVGARRA